ncbi:MAG: L-histidine N(alpha)-methyltransferase [Planctomycetes bacterium]|nr:L-histidine N(alpha)-methyltransferase [Planctomycetota bacterium]
MTISARLIQASEVPSAERAAFARDVLEGLSAEPKHLSCKWFYDARGSELINSIMDLDEYYLTRCEAEVFEQHAVELVRALGDEPFELVDLGAGDGRKTGILIRRFLELGARFEFFSIDISESASRSLAATLAREFPTLAGETLVAEYASGLAWLAERSTKRKLVLFLGSNIGNSSLDGARAFLGELGLALREDDLVLVGADLVKDVDVLRRAYDDSRGLTAAFNLNLLARIDRELGGRFERGRFRFYSTWEPRTSAIESYLVSLAEQEVAIDALGRSFHFGAHEAIHTESSRKYTLAELARLAEVSGFAGEAVFQDRRGWFADVLWRVAKTKGRVLALPQRARARR